MIWSIDCNWDSTKIVTGGGDNALILWDLQTGKILSKTTTKTAVRTAVFSNSGKQIFYTTDQAMKMPAEMHIIDINDPSHFAGQSSIKSLYDMDIPKPTAALWGSLDECVITGHENGNIIKWDNRIAGEVLQKVTDQHRNQINDLQYNSDCTMFITSSKDTTAKVIFVAFLIQSKVQLMLIYVNLFLAF